MPWLRTPRAARPKKADLQTLAADLRQIRIHQAAGAAELGTTRFRVEQLADRIAEFHAGFSELHDGLAKVRESVAKLDTQVSA